MLYMLFLPFLPMIGEFGESKGYTTFVWITACIILLIGWLLRALISPSRTIINPMLTISYLFIMVAWLLSLFGGPAIATMNLEMQSIIRSTIIEAFIGSTILLASISAATSPERLELIFKVVVWTAVPYAITIFFLGTELEPTGEIGRRQGIFMDVGPASTYMLFASILASVFVLQKKQPVLYGACIILFLLTNLETLSKTAMVITIMVPVIALMFAGRWKVSLAVIVATPLVLISIIPVLPAFLVNVINQTFTSLFIDSNAVVAGQGGTFSLRIEHFWLGIEIFKSNMLIGFGLAKPRSFLPIPLHMTYATILAETGIIGFLAFATFITLVFRNGFQVLNAMVLYEDKDTRLLIIAILLCFIIILITLSTQPWRGQEERLLWVIAGWIGGMQVWAKRSGLLSE